MGGVIVGQSNATVRDTLICPDNRHVSPLSCACISVFGSSNKQYNGKFWENIRLNCCRPSLTAHLAFAKLN